MRSACSLVIAVLAFAVACNQKTETQTVNTPTGTVQQKTTTVTVNPQVDTTATAEAKQDVKNAAREVKREVQPSKKKH